MRPLGSALALAVAVMAVPAVLGAQETPVTAPINPSRPPYIRPPSPPRPGHSATPYRPQHSGSQRYPVIIDGSVVDRYLATPGPTARPAAHKPTPRPAGAPDQFDTHTNGGG